MACRPRPARTPDELGVLESTFGGPSEFYGAFIQIAHTGQQPVCKEPAFRILRVVHSKKEASKAQRKLQQELAGTGNILLQLRNAPTLICKDLDHQVDAEYVLPTVHKLKADFLAHIRGMDEDFVANRRDRMEGKQAEAKARQDLYIANYQTKGWVQFMRQEYNIRADVDIVPGMHTEAEDQSRQLNERDAKAATAAQAEPAPAAGGDAAAADLEPEGDDTDGDFDEFPPVPEPLKNRTQRFAAISFLLCDTDKMECLLFIHGVFGSEDEAKDYTVNTLNDMVYPLPVEVVDMYEWCYPIRMTWENNASSKRVVGLDETCAELLLQESQQQRLEALRHNQNIKEETRKKKEMHQEVQKQICERLQLDDAQFTSILEHPDLGTNEIIRICKIEDEAERHGEVAEALARVA